VTARVLPLSRPVLRDRLARFPRVPLASLPTPLVAAPRLSAALDINVWIKREDLAGLGVGGSKYRILELTLGGAVAEGADVCVAAGLTQSNHPQQVAAAAARLGIPSVLLLGGARGHLAWQGNLLLAGLSGAEVHVLPEADFDELREAQVGVAERLRAMGRRPAVVTLTHAVHLLSVFAYAGYALELVEQLETQQVPARTLYVGSGGPTYAGMLLGSLALGAPLRVVGVTPRGTVAECREHVAGLVREAAGRLEIELPDLEEAICITDAFLGPGHGVTTPGAVDAIRLVASTEGLFLDPVYSGKAMAGLVEHARSGVLASAEAVVFAHTGGIPALFAHADQVMADPLPIDWQAATSR
jgi:1-aminocyclopropane-1-carboxylate deaminase/D-cysteine desulfhydrase-like pyridoxal-dependent ACC family enzyme